MSGSGDSRQGQEGRSAMSAQTAALNRAKLTSGAESLRNYQDITLTLRDGENIMLVSVCNFEFAYLEIM